MKYTDLKNYFNHHCKIRLRSGKEVFGVLWEEMNDAERAIYFASFIEHKKRYSGLERKTAEDLSIKLSEEEILGIEPVDPFS